MKPHHFSGSVPIWMQLGSWLGTFWLTALFALPGSCLSESIELLTVPHDSYVPSASAAGDSTSGILSQDGRYVLFASTAGNLVLMDGGSPIRAVIPTKCNVFLRDRTTQITKLLSVSTSGLGGGNGDSFPAGFSTDARYALFISDASDLVPGDTNNSPDVFVRDLSSQTTILVSKSSTGLAANGASRGAVMTPEGHYVAFASDANNLVAGDTNGIADVFVRDMQAGVTTLVSAGAKSSGNASYGGSEAPVITPDGRFVGFYSGATNLVDGATHPGDLYIRDLLNGTTVQASAYALTAVGVIGAIDYSTCNHALSADGRFMSYQANPEPAANTSVGLIVRYDSLNSQTDVIHTNALFRAGAAPVTGALNMTEDGRFVAFLANTNGKVGFDNCVLVWDAQTGTTTLASGTPEGQVPTGACCLNPSMDPTGRFVVFLSNATNLVSTGTSMGWHTYFRDLEAGTTKAVDTAPGGISALSGTATIPQITTDGRFVIFESPDSSLVSNDGNGCVDVFVRDLLTDTTELISGRYVTLPSHSPRAISLISSQPVSSDGRIVVFSSAASDLLPGATNSPGDAFARDRLLETNLPVNVSGSGDKGNGPAFDPALSGNGRFVAFTSWANNLSSEADSNGTSDVYVRDLQAGTTALISIETSGLASGNAASHSPAISADGRFVLFRSLATNLAVGSYTGENLFLRDRQTETTYPLTSSGLQCHAMTPDGRYVVFSTSRILLWDSLEARVVWTNLTSTTRISLSPDGNKIAFYSYPGNITIADRAASSSWTVPSAQNFHPGLRFSTNGNWLVYVAASNGFNQVFLHHVQFRTNELITRIFGSEIPASGHSDSPDISPDGRFIAYRSSAPDLVPGDNNAVPDVFLHDRLSHTTVLLSANLFGSASAANRSATPIFSGDGQTIVFQSWAPDMVQHDFNDMNDLFAWTIHASGELPLFSAQISKDTGGAWLAWPVVPGKTYRVQYKSNPADPTWTDLDAGIAVLGNQGCLRDMTVGPGPRFYRVAAY